MTRNIPHLVRQFVLVLLGLGVGPVVLHYALFGEEAARPRTLLSQSRDEAYAKSASCIQCHKDSHDPHFKDSFHLGCVDCHGGNASATTKEIAHLHPSFPDAWPTAGNPI